MARERSELAGLGLQVGLIVVPLAILLFVGLYFLRQDKLLVQSEARERADGVARQFMAEFKRAQTNFAAPGAYTNLIVWPESEAFFQTANGELTFPAALQTNRLLTAITATLSPSLSNLWKEAEETEFLRKKPAEALQAWTLLSKTNLPARAQAAAKFNLAVLLRNSGQDAEAAMIFDDLRKIPITERLDSGLPIAHLSELKLLNSENAQTNSLDAGWRFISEPTEFTELLLDQLTNDSELKTRLLALWNQHERARLLYAALPLSPNNTGFIQKRVTVAGTNWWVLNSGNGYYGRSQEGMSQVSQDIIAMENVPEYLSLAYFSAGQLLFSGPEKGLLIASLSIDGDQSTEPERVEIYLAKPELLYARQRQRWLWLEALLGFSTIVAIAGVTHTTRSYLKQQRLNELKSNFVSSVSHELRAPLASMRLMSEGLQSGRIHDREKQREYYNYLVQECRRLSVLVENVLDFSRIDQNRKVYEFEPVDLGLVIESALKTMSPVAAERQVRVEFSTLEKCGQVRADGLALQQAIVNLLDNAIKHSPAGEKVMISLEEKQSAFEILVRDRGPGVPEAERERIFERFYRLGSELRRETPGVGIGLSIVKHIVEAHQGTVRVEGVEGHGATFTISIPKT